MGKDRNWFKHDVGASRDPKLLALRLRGGRAALSMYWETIELMNGAGGGWIDSELDALALALAEPIEEVGKFVNNCLEIGLFRKNEGIIFSPRTVREIAEFGEAREAGRHGGRISGQVRANSNPPVEPPPSSPPLNPGVEGGSEPLREEKRRIDKIREEKKEKKPLGRYGRVFLSDSELDGFVSEHGKEFIDRAIDKLDSYIESDNTSKKKLRNGKNAAATFRSWVLNAVAEERSKVGTAKARPPSNPGRKLSTFELNAEMLKDLRHD